MKKVLGSVHKINMGGSVVVFDGDKTYMQNKETNYKTRVNYERASTSCEFGCSCEGDGDGAEGQALRRIEHVERGSSGFHRADEVP